MRQFGAQAPPDGGQSPAGAQLSPSALSVDASGTPGADGARPRWESFHVGELIGILRHHGLQPGQIVIELTEREAIEDLSRLRNNLERVRAAGFRVAADDVGAGNAGLRLLSEIAFDIVKIDLSLVQRGLLHDSSLAVLRGLREMARRSGATVVAEGVETPEQLVALQRLGITSAQGYLLGRPSDRPVATEVDLDTIASMSNLDEVAIAS